MTTYARRLGLFSGTMAAVGGIIGGGIFRTPATVAERLRSPGLVLLAWVIGGLVALIGAFCFGELGQRRPRAGGGYVYLRETFGPLLAFLYGWTLVLVIATGAIAAVSVTFADYTLALAGLSHRLSAPLAVAAIVFLSGINYLGVRPAAITQNIFTILKLAALAVLIDVRIPEPRDPGDAARATGDRGARRLLPPAGGAASCPPDTDRRDHRARTLRGRADPDGNVPPARRLRHIWRLALLRISRRDAVRLSRARSGSPARLCRPRLSGYPRAVCARVAVHRGQRRHLEPAQLRHQRGAHRARHP